MSETGFFTKLAPCMNYECFLPVFWLPQFHCVQLQHFTAYSLRPIFSVVLPCVWLWDQWVGVALTHVLGTTPTLDLFGCENGFDLFSVWLEDWDGVGSILFFVWLDGFKQNLDMVTFALKWWGYPPQFMLILTNINSTNIKWWHMVISSATPNIWATNI
jgi:hypothetical protein